MSFAVVPSEEISHRCDFSLLANARGYLDAVEVGVDLGVFAADFLSRFKGHWLIGVDDYAPHAEFPFDRTGDLAVAVQAIAPYHGRFRLVRGRSPDCVPWVRTFVSPSFVYVDGSHEEADVRADLEAWWEALPEGGCLAGHDHDAAHPGVTRAVERFARDRGLVVRLTQETAAPASYYMYKGGEPEKVFVRLWSEGERDNPRRA